MQFGDVTTLTLLISGNQDQAIGRKAVEDEAAFMKGPYKFVELDAGHWLIQEKAAEVIAEISAQLKANSLR